MKILLVIFLVFSALFLIFGDLKLNGKKAETFIERLICSILGGFEITIIFGLPILGILYLIQ